MSPPHPRSSNVGFMLHFSPFAVKMRVKVYFHFLTLIYSAILGQILYKSRCDSRLNEITERVSADKREVIDLFEHILHHGWIIKY